jgi:hypothetical protein
MISLVEKLSEKICDKDDLPKLPVISHGFLIIPNQET